MSRDRTAAALAAVVAACSILAAGCGATSLFHAGLEPSVAVPTRVPAGDVRVIRDWANALRAGNIHAAARYFEIPSIFFDGEDPAIELRTVAQVEAANAALTCGARFISAREEGGYVNALFRLTNRPGPGGAGGCGAGTGQTARTDFLIRNGRILEWLRAPDQSGGNSTPTQPSPVPRITTPVDGPVV